MPIKTGKEEIVYLLTRVLEKYEAQTGHSITRNTNRKNYEDVARMLSDISNELPYTSEKWQHEKYAPDPNPKKLSYPFRKYDITGNQIKDAYFNQIVANPRSFLVDACYIYLYGTGRIGFEKTPADPELLYNDKGIQPDHAVLAEQENEKLRQEFLRYRQEQQDILTNTRSGFKKQKRILFFPLLLLSALLIALAVKWNVDKAEWQVVKSDMNLLPYQPTQAEIDSLEGVWICYTGSPQARGSDPNRYHMVVSNVVDIRFKKGYFTFMRYGASFDHIGYMQFEAPWLVSIHSYVRNGDSIASPRHSLMRLDEKSNFLSVISASWNFDVGKNNSIIGIREVYIKQGKGGKMQEVMNTIENSGCHCKILRWQQQNGSQRSFFIKNQLLDSLPDDTLKTLIDEKSILLRRPQDELIFMTDSVSRLHQ